MRMMHDVFFLLAKSFEISNKTITRIIHDLIIVRTKRRYIYSLRERCISHFSQVLGHGMCWKRACGFPSTALASCNEYDAQKTAAAFFPKMITLASFPNCC